MEIIPIEIKKSNTNIFENTLHLDCCFQTVGPDKAIICPDGFKNKEDYEFLINFFGRKNVLIYGTGSSSRRMANILSNDLEIKPVGFISDDDDLEKTSIAELSVYQA